MKYSTEKQIFHINPVCSSIFQTLKNIWNWNIFQKLKHNWTHHSFQLNVICSKDKWKKCSRNDCKFFMKIYWKNARKWIAICLCIFQILQRWEWFGMEVFATKSNEEFFLVFAENFCRKNNRKLKDLSVERIKTSTINWMISL